MAKAASKLEDSAAVTLLIEPIRPLTPNAAAITSYRLAMIVMLTDALYQIATDERALIRISVRDTTKIATFSAVEIHKKGRND
jgi:hypothetical protein